MQEQEFIPKQPKTKYKKWMCDTIIKVAENGGHVSAMCKAIGMNSRDTFYRWLDLYKDFREAYEESKISSQDFYENILLAGALGKIKNYNFPSIAMILNNKFGKEYKRTGYGATTEINIGSINSIDKLTTQDLDEKILQLQDKLDLIPAIKVTTAEDKDA